MLVIIAVIIVLCMIELLLKILFWRPRFKVEGKTVFITGGSTGIGKALAIEAIKRGAKVVYIVARNQNVLDEAQEEIQSHAIHSNQRVITISCDVSDLEQVKYMAHILENDPDKKCSSLDFVIINQGISEPGYFLEQDPLMFKKMIDVNYLGGVYVTRYLLPIMMRFRKANDDSKHLVYVSSALGILTMMGFAAYCASKHAIRAFAECMRAELDGTGIIVQCSLPPDTQTPGFEKEMLTKPPETKILSEVAGLAKPADVAKAIFKDMASGGFILSNDFIICVAYSIIRGIAPFYSLLLFDWLVTCLSAAVAPLFRFYFWLVPYRLRKQREQRFLKAITNDPFGLVNKSVN